MGSRFRRALIVALTFITAAGVFNATAQGPEKGARQLTVLMSLGFAAAYRAILPEFERSTGVTVVTLSGQSIGNNPNAIRAQLRRGVFADIVILSREGLEELIADRRIVSGTETDLASTSLAVAVRAGMPKPDISTVDAFRRALVRANSVAFTSSTSGVYLATVLFPRLGIADEMARKSTSDAVAAVVRGDADFVIQPMSELLPVAGIDIVGPIPAEIQKVNVYAAAVLAGSKEMGAARALIAQLSSDSAAAAIRKSGMEPSRRQ